MMTSSTNDSRSPGLRAGDPTGADRGRTVDDVFSLLLSTLLFGYFGFLYGLTDRAAPDGPVIPMFATFLWTLRLSAIGFAIAFVLALLRQPVANIVSGVVGLLGAVAFLGLAIWDWMDPAYGLRLSPIVLVLFAMWNGYSSLRLFGDGFLRSPNRSG